ncbi:MAG: PspC domain-containing protein [Minisyncoccia bacterium]
MTNTKRIYKSNTNKVVFGVIGGVGEYYDMDPTILRLGYILIGIVTGFMPALIGYFIGAIVVPSKPSHHHFEN